MTTPTGLTRRRALFRNASLRRARAAFAFGALTAATPAVAARGQSAPAPTLLRLPVSARALGMGGGLPVATDGDAWLASPALLGLSRGASLQAQRWGSAATLGALAMSMGAPGGTLGIAATALDWGAPAARYPDAARDAAGALGARGPVNASGLSLAVGYGRTWLGGVRTGIAVKAVEERLGSARDGTVAVDVGLAKGMLFDNVVVSLAAQDLGAGLRLAGTRAPLPSRVTAGFSGAGFPVTTWLDVGGNFALSVLRGGRVATGGGVEAALVPLDGYLLALRVGARRGGDAGDEGVTAGVGLTRDRLSVDWAYQPVNGRPAHRVGLRIR